MVSLYVFFKLRIRRSGDAELADCDVFSYVQTCRRKFSFMWSTTATLEIASRL